MTRQYLWDSPRLKTFDVVKLVDAHIKKGSTKSDACRIVAEEIFARFNGPKLTASQINNRYIYLKNQRKKIEEEVLEIANNPKVKEKIKEVGDTMNIPLGAPTIWSKTLVDIHNKGLNLNAFAYSLIDGEKLARGIQKLYQIQQRRDNRVEMNEIIACLAGFFNVKNATLYSRYHTNLKKIENDKYVAKLERDNVKALKAQLEIMTRSEKQERSFHLSLKTKVEQQEKQLFEQSRKIKELQSQTIIEFIKMKFQLGIQNPPFKKIWRR